MKIEKITKYYQPFWTCDDYGSYEQMEIMLNIYNIQFYPEITHLGDRDYFIQLISPTLSNDNYCIVVHSDKSIDEQLEIIYKFRFSSSEYVNRLLNLN